MKCSVNAYFHNKMKYDPGYTKGIKLYTSCHKSGDELSNHNYEKLQQNNRQESFSAHDRCSYHKEYRDNDDIVETGNVYAMKESHHHSKDHEEVFSEPGFTVTVNMNSPTSDNTTGDKRRNPKLPSLGNTFQDRTYAGDSDDHNDHVMGS